MVIKKGQKKERKIKRKNDQKGKKRKKERRKHHHHEFSREFCEFFFSLALGQLGDEDDQTGINNSILESRKRQKGPVQREVKKK